jgi:glycosyltransferase involved in cell wall biosynthesis
MSYGLSCIVSEIPANRNVNLPDNRHFISGDINGLAEKLNEFTANEFSINDRDIQIEKIKKDYNWETIAKETVMVYQKVLNS